MADLVKIFLSSGLTTVHNFGGCVTYFVGAYRSFPKI